MADAVVSIGLDLDALMLDAKKAATQVKQEFERHKPKLSLDLGSVTYEVDRLSNQFKTATQSASRASYEIKAAMAQLIASGQKGTDEYKKLEAELRKVTEEAKKLDDAFREVENTVQDVGNKAGKSFSENFKSGIQQITKGNFSGIFQSLGSGFLGGAVAGIAIEGFRTLAKTISDLYQEGAKLDAMNDMLIRSFRQAGLTAEETSKQVELAGKTATELAFQYGQSKDKLKEYIGLAASLGGVVGEQNTQLTKLAIGIETATQGMVSGEEVIRAFTRGLSDPEAQNAIDRMSKKFPQLATVMRGTGDMATKLNEALKLVSPTLEELEKDFQGPDSAMQRFSMMVNELKETVATEFFNIVNQIITPINSFLKSIDLSPIKESIGAIFNAFKDRIGIIIDLVNTIFSAFSKGFSDGENKSSNFFKTLVDTFLSVQQTFTDIVKKIIDFFKPIINSLITHIGSIVSIVYNTISGIVSEISSFFTTIKNEIFGVGEQSINISQSIAEIIKYISSIIITGGKILSNVILTTIRIIFNILTNIVRVVKEVFTWIGEKIYSAVKSVYNFFVNIYNAISSAISGLASWLGVLEPIKKAINAIYEGIKSAVQWIVDLANKVGNFLGNLFGSAPEQAKKEGEKTGTQFASGVADSIAQQARTLQSVLQQYLQYDEETFKKNSKKIKSTISETNKFLESIKNDARYQNIYAELSNSVQQVSARFSTFSKSVKTASEKTDENVEKVRKLQSTYSEIQKSIEQFTEEVQSIEKQKIKIETEIEIESLTAQKEAIVRNTKLTETERLEQIRNIELKIQEIRYQQRVQEINDEIEKKQKSIEIARDEALQKIDVAIQEARAKREAKKIEEAKTEEEIQSLVQKLESQKQTIIQQSNEKIVALNALKVQQLNLEEQKHLNAVKKITEEYNQKIQKSYQNNTEVVKGFTETVLEEIKKINFSKIIEETAKTNREVKKELQSIEKEYTKSVKSIQSELAKGAISYTEFTDRYYEALQTQAEKTSELLAKQKSEWQLFASVVGEAFGQISDVYFNRVTQSLENFEKNLEIAREKAGENFDEMAWKMEQFQKIAADMGVAVGFSLMEGLAKGENISKRMAQMLLSMLPKIVATYATQIYGFYASLGPWMIPAALATIGVLYAMMRTAFAAKEGYMKGIREKRERGPKDTQLIWINPEEVILTPEMKEKNKEALEYIFRTGGTLEEYYERKLKTKTEKIIINNLFQVIDFQKYIKKISNERVEFKNVFREIKTEKDIVESAIRNLETEKIIQKKVLRDVENIIHKHISESSSKKYIPKSYIEIQSQKEKFEKTQNKPIFQEIIFEPQRNYIDPRILNELQDIKSILKSTKLVDIRNANKVIIEDNRKVQVKQIDWVAR